MLYMRASLTILVINSHETLSLARASQGPPGVADAYSTLTLSNSDLVKNSAALGEPGSMTVNIWKYVLATLSVEGLSSTLEKKMET